MLIKLLITGLASPIAAQNLGGPGYHRQRQPGLQNGVLFRYVPSAYGEDNWVETTYGGVHAGEERRYIGFPWQLPDMFLANEYIEPHQPASSNTSDAGSDANMDGGASDASTMAYGSWLC